MNERQAEIYTDTLKIVQQRGGILLAESYVNASGPLLVECCNGHQWESSRQALKTGDWCPRCAGRGRIREEIAAVAQVRGGDLVSDAFTTMNARYRWKCELGHEWDATANNVVHNGRWCPECGRKKSDASRRRYSLGDLQSWAKAKGGECLASEFISVIDKVAWRCHCGFEWKAEVRKIRDGSWCPECAKGVRGEKRRVHTAKSLKEFARSKGGKCYPPKTFDVKTPVEWSCLREHHWMANADNVINGGKWCPECAGNKQYSITDMEDLARLRYGECLSKTYVNSKTALEWRCSVGHTWHAVPASVVSGGWCPTCSAGLGERICREHFEQLLNSKFPKARPAWLRSAKGHQLELDGFSSELSLAFEHHGTQHYKKVDRFHSSKSAFLGQQERDVEKRRLCEENGVDLIEVPSVLEILGVSEIAPYLARQLKELGRIVPDSLLDNEVDYSEAYRIDEIVVLQAVAAQRGGELLSTTYLGIFEKLEWRCANGHEFSAAPNNVKNSGSWCPRCAGRGQTISDMKALAAKRAGDCLSDEYVDNKAPLLWRCAEGHTWEARPSNVKFGTWCPHCATVRRGLNRRKYDLNSLKEAAKSRGGFCESTEYLGYKVKHQWKCSCGAIFEMTAERVLSGQAWCSKCRKVGAAGNAEAT